MRLAHVPSRKRNPDGINEGVAVRRNEEMNRLCPLGVFGLGGEDPFSLDPAKLEDLRGSLDSATRLLVAKYLLSGTIILALMEYTPDVLENSFGVSGGSGVLSDGTYYWRRDAAEYVQNYDIDVGSTAVEHMREQSWVAPSVTRDTIKGIDEYLTLILSNSGN
jgi:hypothetical protein